MEDELVVPRSLNAYETPLPLLLFAVILYVTVPPCPLRILFIPPFFSIVPTGK